MSRGRENELSVSSNLLEKSRLGGFSDLEFLFNLTGHEGLSQNGSDPGLGGIYRGGATFVNEN
jgi:hypothetical protein